MLKWSAAVVAIAGLMIAGQSSTAVACSLAGYPPLIELLNSNADQYMDEMSGVYVQRHIAWVPSLFVRGARSVSMIERYWGAPPNLSKTVHGEDGIFTIECGNGARLAGSMAVGIMTTGQPPDQMRFSYTGFPAGELGDSELEALTERFGPPVVLSAGFLDYALAYTMILWQPIAVLGALAGFVVLGRRFRARGGDRRSARADSEAGTNHDPGWVREER